MQSQIKQTDNAKSIRWCTVTNNGTCATYIIMNEGAFATPLYVADINTDMK